MRVNLLGHKPLAGARLAQDQYRTVALGNPGQRALDPRRHLQSRVPLLMLDCFACHKNPMLISYLAIRLPIRRNLARKMHGRDGGDFAGISASGFNYRATYFSLYGKLTST
jgi:hypothetical protein